MSITVIAGIQEEVSQIYAGASNVASSVKPAATSNKNYICKMMLNYYNICYSALTSGVKVASNALSAAQKVTTKIKSEVSSINSSISNAFSSQIVSLKSMPTEVRNIKFDVDNSANMPISTLVRNNVPLDSEYAKNIISGLNQVKTSVIFDLVPTSGKLNITALISSGKLRSDGVSNNISLDYSTYSDKAKDRLSQITDKIDSLPNSASDLFGDTITESLSSVNTTLNSVGFDQLTKLESMYDNAIEIGHVKEICVLMGLIQQYIEDYCTDLEIRKELESKPVSKLLEQVGGTVEEKTSGTTSGDVISSRYSYSFDFKKAANVEEATKEAKPLDTTTYTLDALLSPVKVVGYGVNGLKNYHSKANAGKFLPEPYYGYYKEYLTQQDQNAKLASILHIDDEKSRKIFFLSKSQDDIRAFIQNGLCKDVVAQSLLQNKYLSEYGVVDIPLTYSAGTLSVSDCTKLLFTTQKDIFTDAVACSANITNITVDGKSYKWFVLSPMQSSKTGTVPDFFKAYTGTDCAFRNLVNENSTYYMYMFR